MYNSSVIGGSVSVSDNRLFIYEVKELGSVSGATVPVRQSGSIFITVPYSRMAEESKRIMRMGGTIVSIRAVDGEFSPASTTVKAPAATKPMSETK
ncbi:MAG: ferredoxin-NADP reductase, partial [Symploca sp. SIO2G7]|nr:ferredoxin-NADP reductase [Symploca sp. SIO2G7]